jgi:tRNA threonylcarbamoyladenosine biosynthesis protein TsaB
MPEHLHLALDTSASRPAAAILCGERVLAEWLGPDELRHHETLLAGIDGCLKSAGLPLKDLSFLSIGVGPGMFTGLRIGVVTAKFLADPLGLPCVPVSSLLALALQADAASDRPVWAISDARSQRVYAFRCAGFAPDYSAPEGEEEALDPKEAAARIQEGDRLVGEGAWLYRALWPAHSHLLPEADHALRASAVGRIGARRYALGLTCPAVELQPKYLKTGNQAHL